MREDDDKNEIRPDEVPADESELEIEDEEFLDDLEFEIAIEEGELE